MAYATEIKRITGLQIDLTLEEAQGLYDLLFRGVGCKTLNDLQLHELMEAIRYSGTVTEYSRTRFEATAQAEVIG